MSSERIFFIVLFAVVLNGNDACFRSNQHQITSIVTGSLFYQECQCSEEGYSVDDLRWIKNNGEAIPSLPTGPGRGWVHTRPNVFTEEQGDSLNLHIPSITKTMSDIYKCVTQVNGVTYTQSHAIYAYDPVYFFETSSNQHLVLGKSSPIMCHPKSDSTVIIKWQKVNENEEPIDISNDDKYLVKSDRLIIHNVTEKDAGNYTCTAQVIATNEELDKFIKVEVFTEPKILHVKATPDNYNPTTVIAGKNLTIECVAEGLPHPEYVWTKATKVDDITWRQDINTIIFDEIVANDSGIYTCFATNAAGTSVKNISVEVLIPPYVKSFPNITAVEGSTVQFFCNATGKSNPKISITYFGKNLNGDLNEILEDIEPMKNNDSMFIDRSKKGIYICNATNEVASVQVPMYLTVLHRPYFDVEDVIVWGWEGKTMNFDCDPDSNPPVNITWRFHGNNDIPTNEELEINRRLATTLNDDPEPYFTLTIDNETAYGIYECTAKNVYGEATKRITLVEGFRPGHALNISFEEPSATSIIFHMDGPDHVEGPEVIGFTATYDEEENYNVTDIHINRTWAIGRPYKLDKLKPNTTYLVRFAAVNEVGPGTWSIFYEFTTLDKSVPEPPTWNEEPILLGTNSHVLKWKASDDNGEPIEYYTLRYCVEADEELCKTKQVSPTTELELIDLEFNTTYFLELVAHNAEGDSLPANISIVVPAPAFYSPTTQLSGGAVIGISIVIVILCLLLLDVLLLVWRRQGIIATCCFKKDNKRKESPVNSRDKKGLLTNGESEERPGSVRNNGHKEFQYNKNTGVVTGKHSAV